jgi:hypothetical protein
MARQLELERLMKASTMLAKLSRGVGLLVKQLRGVRSHLYRRSRSGLLITSWGTSAVVSGMLELPVARVGKLPATSGFPKRGFVSKSWRS